MQETRPSNYQSSSYHQPIFEADNVGSSNGCLVSAFLDISDRSFVRLCLYTWFACISSLESQRSLHPLWNPTKKGSLQREGRDSRNILTCSSHYPTIVLLLCPVVNLSDDRSSRLIKLVVRHEQSNFLWSNARNHSLHCWSVMVRGFLSFSDRSLKRALSTRPNFQSRVRQGITSCVLLSKLPSNIRINQIRIQQQCGYRTI